LANSKDVARLAGVSRATVSNVINSARYVSPELVKRVENAIRQLNYFPNGVAKSLAVKKTFSVGLLVPRIASPFYPYVISAIEKTLAKEGYSIILGDSNENLAKEEKILRVLVEKRVDGLLWVPCGEKNADFIRPLARSGIPVVIIDRRLEKDEFDTVVSDNLNAGKIATEYLLSLGYRRIAILTFSQKIVPGKERLQGYYEAHREARVKVDKELVCIARFPEFKNIRLKLASLLQRPEKPEAIFACTDLLTLAVIQEIKREGLRIPQDIAVIGFDDSQWGAFLDPPLTVVTQNTQSLGTIAAQILLKRLNKRSVESPEIIKIPAKLIRRRSCGESSDLDKNPFFDEIL
jgi:LacI family transcriptional regulator